MNRKLTKRQYQVIALIANGYTANMVAQELGISPQTVKNHVGSIYKILDAGNKQHAFIKMGWLVPPMVVIND